MENVEKKLIARWESKSKKYWIELYLDVWGYSYSAGINGSGFLGLMPTDEDAIGFMERNRVNYVQPDKNKTPMKRVK